MASIKTSLFPRRFTTSPDLLSLVPLLALIAACGTDPNETGNGDGDENVTASGGAAPGAGGTLNGTGGGGGIPGGGGDAMQSGGASTGGTIETVECQGSLPADAVDGVMHAVSVQPGSVVSALPHFWNTYGTGHLGLYLREDRGWGQTLKEHTLDGIENLGLTSLRQHGLFHDDIGIYTEDESGNPVYNFEKSDQIFDFFVEKGIEPIIELAPMPSALAADTSKTVFDWKMIVSEPKDYGRWQELVYKFVEHSIERYGVDVISKWYFEVWNEPECCNNKFWAGDLPAYHKLYDYAAAGVRAALPDGRIGGPVASQPIELNDNSQSGRLFLDHVTTGDNYAAPGTPVIFDFFTFHSWSFVRDGIGAVDGYFKGLDLLKEYGKNDTKIAVTEFGPTWQFGLEEEPQEMDQGAAFVAQTYSQIAQRAAKDGRHFPITYSWWVLSDVFEEGLYFEEDPFIGCMGLISRENIKKPAYNAYKFLADMGQEQVALSVAGPGDVGGMAARDNAGGIQVILYNGQNPGNGPGSPAGSSTAEAYYDITDPQQIGITLTGLNPEIAYNVTSYRVDDSHGNAYAVWQEQGRPAMSEMSEADWQALRDNMESPAEPIGQALCGESYSQVFELPSPGVLFLTFTPAVN